MLNPGELYGPGYTIFDLKLGKNLRIASRRLNVGVDIYNLFNKEQVLTYQDNYDTVDNPTTPIVEQWGQPAGWPRASCVCRYSRLLTKTGSGFDSGFGIRSRVPNQLLIFQGLRRRAGAIPRASIHRSPTRTVNSASSVS
jgi:hypothetical protein